MSDLSRARPELPPIPAKRYFTIGEVSDLCAVKPHVLRYWEQEFSQLKPVKRRGNRRYYQHHEVLLIRRIRDLLYEQGFTINGARHRPRARRRRSTRGRGAADTVDDQRAHAAALGSDRFPAGRCRLAAGAGRNPAPSRPGQALTGDLRHAHPDGIIDGFGRGVAQPGSAPAWGAGGRKFESSRPDHSNSRSGRPAPGREPQGRPDAPAAALPAGSRPPRRVRPAPPRRDSCLSRLPPPSCRKDVTMTPSAPIRTAPSPGSVSELAFARAQRNTVLIIDDLFSSRLLLAEIVRQIDGKLNLELFDTPSRALEFARNNRVDIVLTDYKLPEFDGIELVKQLRSLRALRRRADRRDHRRRRPQDPLRRARGRRDRLPDQAARRARDARALREPARAAPAQDRAVRPGARAAVPGRQLGVRDPRARARDAGQAREGRRVPRQDHRQPPDADGALFGADRHQPRPRRRDRRTCSRSPRRCTTSARSASPMRSCSRKAPLDQARGRE